ncbi:MAG: TonB-dependent receptor [Bacteroidia bacterium]|nr:TonB-dependent receptor [Bacteroidia bacterium]
MKYIFYLYLLCFSTILCAQNKDSILQRSIVVQPQEKSIKEWFKEIEKQQIIVAYNPREIELGKKIKVSSSVLSLENLLHLLLDQNQFYFKTAENKIIIIKKPLSFTVSGFIRDIESKEGLIGATLFIQNTGTGTASNMYGFFSITLPKGEYLAEVRYMGYEMKTFPLVLVDRNLKLDIELHNQQTILKEIEVIAPTELGVKNGDMQRINLQEKDKYPQLFGVDDVLKRIQQLSGVGLGVSGITQLKVRGGNSDNNLVLLDGVPIYNYNHFTGLLSVFNSDALKHVDFYKGTFPARYNGRLSSVMDIRMREGNMHTYHGGGSIDMATLAGFAEGPIIKEKSSFLISVRRSWIDLFAKKWESEIFNNDFALHDINIKANYRPNNKNHFFLSLYTGADKFWESYTTGRSKVSLSWGNNLAALRWNHILSDKIFVNNTLYYSQFSNSMANDTVIIDIQSEKEKLNTLNYTLSELALSTDFEYYGEFLNLRLGNKLTFNQFQRPHLRSIYSSLSADEKKGLNTSTFQEMVYFENKMSILKNLNINVGLNYNLFSLEKDVFHRFQSRVMLNYDPWVNQSFYIGFSEMSQFFHQLSLNTISYPYEFRLPSSRRFPPSTSRLYEIGYRGKFDNNRHEISASLYLNNQYGVLRYRPQQKVWDTLLAPEIENQVLQGKNNGRGFELFHRFNFQPFELNSSYTLSDMKERFSGIDNGKPYPASNHSLHVIKSMLNWRISQEHSLALSFTYNTGQHITIPLYEIPNIDDVAGTQRPDIDPTATTISLKHNSYRLPHNYQLDIGYTFHKVTSNKNQNILRLGVYNVFGKALPLSVLLEKNLESNKYVIKQTVMPNFIPYLSYSFKF